MMGSLTVKVQVRLSKDDAPLLSKVAKARRSGQGPIFREVLMEWFVRRGYMGEEEKKAFGVLLQEAFAMNHAQKE